jgi:hypothetical protein
LDALSPDDLTQEFFVRGRLRAAAGLKDLATLFASPDLLLAERQSLPLEGSC